MVVRFEILKALDAGLPRGDAVYTGGEVSAFK
jgi:hypothetical protein